MAAVNLNPCNAVRLQVAVNYTIFLHEIKNDTMRAVNLMKVTQELALTAIDDSAQAFDDFTQEEFDLLETIKSNLALFMKEKPMIGNAGSSILLDEKSMVGNGL